MHYPLPPPSSGTKQAFHRYKLFDLCLLIHLEFRDGARFFFSRSKYSQRIILYDWLTESGITDTEQLEVTAAPGVIRLQRREYGGFRAQSKIPPQQAGFMINSASAYEIFAIH